MPRRQRIKHQPAESPELLRLIRAIISDDASEFTNLLASLPSLAKQPLTVGDTPLHVAAAGYGGQIARKLLRNGVNVAATNRRGAAPLHDAADGSPGSAAWNPRAQAEMIALLIGAGADPNALDKSGIAPLHRAVRQRCTAAVDSLLGNGASLWLKNKSGSNALSPRGAEYPPRRTGSAGSKALQREIIELFLKAGASPKDRDGHGKTVEQCVRSDWIRELL